MNKHYSVLLNESIKGLAIKSNGIYVDCTLGFAGHSKAIANKLISGKLFSFEQDAMAINFSKLLLNEEILNKKCEIIKANFVNLSAELACRNIKKVDGILYDLGVSSPQFDEPSRGFSYRYDSKLDMRMDTSQTKTAFDIINFYSQAQLAEIFRKYGEEKYSNIIAKKICWKRKEKLITTTFELVAIIKQSLPASVLRLEKHPAKKVFQAIRIEVNNELDVLLLSLQQAAKLLTVSGRLIVISFHSLEDRIVKHFFQNLIVDPEAEIFRHLPITSNFKSQYQIITKKPILPSKEELLENKRSKSAKMRILERIY